VIIGAQRAGMRSNLFLRTAPMIERRRRSAGAGSGGELNDTARGNSSFRACCTLMLGVLRRARVINVTRNGNNSLRHRESDAPVHHYTRTSEYGRSKAILDYRLGRRVLRNGFLMADRIVVLSGGRTLHMGTPRKIYEGPLSPVVALRLEDAAPRTPNRGAELQRSALSESQVLQPTKEMP
jgi:hypothetical protein